MKYQVRVSVGRFIRANTFLSDLEKLKAYRGEYVGPKLLESLEELGLLRPRVRLWWPDTIARRIWLETHDRVDILHDTAEPDGPRMDAAADLWNLLRRSGMGNLSGGTHPFDDPKPEWQEFLHTPDRQEFMPHRDRRVRVSNDARPGLYDSNNAQDFYSSWQLLATAEVADMGIHIGVNMADEDTAERVRNDIRNGQWPEGYASEAFAPRRALSGFDAHEASLDAIVWSMEEERDRTFQLLQGIGGGRVVLTEKQIAARDEIRRSVAEAACTRFGVGALELIACCQFLSERWHEWSREGRPLVADAYKIFLAEGVRLLQIQHALDFDSINEAVGFQGGGGQRVLEIIWPDWDKEQIDRLVLTLRAPDLSEEQLKAFGAFLNTTFQDAVFHRLRSFEKHAFDYGHSRIAGMQSDLQGMSVAVEQTVRAMGGHGSQLSTMFRVVWKGTDVGRILKKHKTLLERAQPPENLLGEINALRDLGDASEVAADLILAARVRGAVHHALEIENQLELEKLFVHVLRAAALIPTAFNIDRYGPIFAFRLM